MQSSSRVTARRAKRRGKRSRAAKARPRRPKCLAACRRCLPDRRFAIVLSSDAPRRWSCRRLGMAGRTTSKTCTAEAPVADGCRGRSGSVRAKRPPTAAPANPRPSPPASAGCVGKASSDQFYPFLYLARSGLSESFGMEKFGQIQPLALFQANLMNRGRRIAGIPHCCKAYFLPSFSPKLLNLFFSAP